MNIGKGPVGVRDAADVEGRDIVEVWLGRIGPIGVFTARSGVSDVADDGGEGV